MPFRRLAKHPEAINYVNSFGGGILFSVGMVHFMKEGNEKIEAYCGGECDAAYAYIIMVLSYMMMLFFLQVLGNHNHAHSNPPDPLEQRLHDTTNSPAADEKSPFATASTEGSGKEQNPEVAAGLLTFISLSFHGIFLGLALGIDRTLAGVINIAIGVLAHKWADTMALSFALRRSKSKYVRPLYLVPLQSLVAPLGILVGMFISEAKNDFVEGFFLCVTAGCFVYFFASDIVAESFNGTGKYFKFLVALLGITIFTVAVSLGEYYSGG